MKYLIHPIHEEYAEEALLLSPRISDKLLMQNHHLHGVMGGRG